VFLNKNLILTSHGHGFCAALGPHSLLSHHRAPMKPGPPIPLPSLLDKTRFSLTIPKQQEISQEETEWLTVKFHSFRFIIDAWVVTGADFFSYCFASLPAVPL